MGKGEDCPECGGFVPLEDANARTVFCEFCGQPLLVLPRGVAAKGRKAALADTPTAVTIGDEVTLRGDRYRVAGRVQYRFEDGLFDHFYLAGAAPCWLEQDEGEFRLFTDVVAVPDAPGWDDVGLGAPFGLAAGQFYPMEFGEGAVVGGAGVLPLVLLPGEAFCYIDGTWNGEAASIRYSAAGVFLLRGATLYAADIRVAGRRS